MRRVILLAALLTAATMVAAQNGASLVGDSDILQFERLFLDEFQSGEYTRAYQRFRTSATALSDSEVDNLEQVTIDQLTRYAEIYGEPVDVILVSTTTVVGAMRKDTYLLRYSNLPLRAQFVFYHNGMQWKLTYFLWDDKTQELLN